MRMMTVALALGLGLVAGAANAVPSPSTLTFTYNSTTSTYDAIFGNDAVTGTFTDTYNFTIPTGAGGEGSATLRQQGGTKFTSFTLWDTTTSTLIATGTSPGKSPLGFTFSELDLGDSFALNVQGYKQGNGGPPSSYTGILSLSPIPEPETYAMMLAGLGLMGFLVARRRKTNAL